MKTLLERLRAARSIEIGLLIVALAVLGLALYGNDTGGGATDVELRLARLLEQIEGVGRVSVMIARDGDGAVTGAVIVAGELEDVRTRLEIESAVQALLGIELDRIRVIGRRGVRGGGVE